MPRIGHRERERLAALRRLAFELQGGRCGICGVAMNPPEPGGMDRKR